MEVFDTLLFRQTLILLSHKHCGTVDQFISPTELPHHVTKENKTSYEQQYAIIDECLSRVARDINVNRIDRHLQEEVKWKER